MQSFASDRYRVIAPLGGGGMAEVFLAMATGAEGFRKPVAIKRMHPHLAASDEIARMFLAEARLAMHLHHQNIVSVFDVGRGPEGLYLVMELVDGWDLGLVLGYEAKSREWMPEPLALYVAHQVSNGLAHAYRKMENGRPIMSAHRDLTPSNVMVTVDGEVKIADFGIAKVESGHTEPGTFKGKVPYAAPEVIRGQPATHLSDQFSLAVMVHRLTSGQYPYGYSENPVKFMEMLAGAGVPPCAGLSEECAAVVRRMLSLAPEGRYPTIEEAGHALGRLLVRSGAVVGAQQLARYLARLNLPPPPSSRVPGDLPARQPDPAPALADEPLQSDWSPPPGGPSLDASGHLTGVAKAARPARETELRPEAGVEDEPLVTVKEDPSAALWQPPPPAPPAPAAEAVPGDGYDPLPNRYGPRARRPGGPLLLLLLLVAAAGGGAYYFIGPRALRAQLDSMAGPPSQAVLIVLSQPDGAQVRIAGKVVGTTPLSQENLYPRGVELEVQVTARGYKPWTGKIRGGESVTLEANLRR